MSEYICIKNLTQMNARINISIENCMNVFTSFHKLTNECPNIFVQTNFIRTNVQINLYIKIDTNVCPNKYLLPIYLNIQIFEYIRHTLFQCQK